MLGLLLTLAMMVGLFVMLPLMVVAAVFKGLAFLIFLPLRILGVVLHLAISLVGGLFKAVFSVVGGLAFLVVGLMLVVAIPLLPLLLLGGFVWALVKACSGTPALKTI